VIGREKRHLSKLYAWNFGVSAFIRCDSNASLELVGLLCTPTKPPHITLEDVQRIPSPPRSRISQYRVILSSRSIHLPLHPSPNPRSSLRTRRSSPYLCFLKPANGQSSLTLFVGRSIFELMETVSEPQFSVQSGG